MVRRKFRLSDMIPNAWFYKLRDMSAHGRGGVGVHHRSSSARSFQPPLSSARWSVEALRQPPSARWNREVSNDVQQPEADVEPPVTPTKESLRAPLPRRASYYYSTRDREVPAPSPRAKDAQSPTRSSRRRHKIDRAPEERGPVSAPARGKVPVVDASASSGRRRDMCIKGDGGEPRRPTVRGTADDGGNVKVIASQNEIIIDLRDEDTPGSRLRPIVTKPARRQPGSSEQDGSHVVDLVNVSARASSASEKSSVSRPRRSSASSSGRRRVKTLSKSPRLAAAARKVNPPARKWTAPPPPLPAPVIVSSYPVVKMSEDPRQDFRESMEEMISAKGIQDAEDLEDLLACYLSLNDAAHHDLIIDVFEQIWVSLAGDRP